MTGQERVIQVSVLATDFSDWHRLSMKILATEEDEIAENLIGRF